MKGMTIGLVGNPNCGKSTVFNALTGSKQRVGNWPGVTVERKSGFFKQQNTTVEVVDLPGTYSLTIISETASIDERIACEFILNRDADVIINILDASNLERNLYLTLQLIEMRVPMIIALNMMDVARQKNLVISIAEIEKRLGCPVVPLEAHKGKGINTLKQAVLDKFAQLQKDEKTYFPIIPYPQILTETIQQIALHLPASQQSTATWLAMRLLENDTYAIKHCGAHKPFLSDYIFQQQLKIHQALSQGADIVLAQARYQFIREFIAKCAVKTHQTETTWTARIDRIILNRVLGIPIFLLVMYGMFLFAINVGGAFQDFFDIGSDTIFVTGLAHLLASIGTPDWLTALLANGLGKGINTTVTFIPVIGAMFLFLAFLEDSGYMSRAAFVVDRLMRAFGLPGKSFVPMIIGFGCNVPSVMATRTLDNPRDRILTIMMSPFMSCGARLAIFAVFTAAFFPVGGQNIVFLLYIIGIVTAMLTGLLLRKTVLQGDPSPLVMEHPPYHLPRFKILYNHAWQRLKNFLFRAGKLIVPICMLIGVLNALNLDGTLNTGEGDTHSLLSFLGRLLTPFFAPMGIHQDNWPATVGLVTGILAKEVVIGTLNTLYSQAAHIVTHAAAFDFWGGLNTAFSSIFVNLSQLGQSFGNPVLAKAPVHTLSQNVYSIMYERFDGKVGAMSYLLFVLLYFPCISTTAAMLRELNRGWALFSIVWTTGVAYIVAVSFYQIATFFQHPWTSLGWITCMGSLFGLTIAGIHLYAKKMPVIPQILQQARATMCGSASCKIQCKKGILNGNNV